MKILVSGNCQARGIHHCLTYLAPTAEVKSAIDVSFDDVPSIRRRASDLDFIFCQASEVEQFKLVVGESGTCVVSYPLIWFDGFHPDMTYVWTKNGKTVNTSTAEYSSAIILFAYKNNLGPSDAQALFNDSSFAKLGYHHRYNIAKEQLLKNFLEAEFPKSAAMEVIYANGECPMLTFNHPRLKILYEVASELLEKTDTKPRLPEGKQYLIDHYLKAAIWGVYPEIAANHRIQGGYYFKSSLGQAVSVLNLEEYILASYQAFGKHDKADLQCPALENPAFDQLLGAGPANGNQRVGYFAKPLGRRGQSSTSNPYERADDFQYWRRELRADHPATINLKNKCNLRLDQMSKIATVGSCFAQQITKHLRSLGCRIMDVEPAPRSMSESQLSDSGYGVYSARYGNIYTARQLYQLVARATGHYNPMDHVWQRTDGKYVDPFRPLVFRDGFDSPAAIEHSRLEHLEAVANLFRELDVCIFTLGLTETWYSKVDDAVFPIAPGVIGGTYDPEIHGYKNFMTSEVVADLLNTYDLVKSLNPQAKVLLTVSPVPIIATYESRSAIISNSYTKSALRAAAEEASNLRGNIHYFPSFELVTGHHLGAHYYDKDLRGIAPRGIERVARAFVNQYFGPKFAEANAVSGWQNQTNEVTCDEAELERIFDLDEVGSGALQ